MTKPKKTVQYYDERGPKTKGSTVEQRLEFLENYRKLLEEQETRPLKLISLKIDPLLLTLFRQKCEQKGLRYQTKIKDLMREWLESSL